MLIKCIDGFTRQFGAPADWDGKDMSCGVLPILDVQTAEGNFMFSAWEPTPPELEALNMGGNIILGVRGTVHPVVSVQVAVDITQTEKHPDDIAVDQFADAMKAKLADARAKGRSGWQDCDPAELSYMLREHVEKGDPRDVANFCMFLWNLDKPIGDTVLPISGHAVPNPPQETFQSRVKPWMMTCFGEAISNDLQERNHRFLEEALELVQSTGCTQSEAHQLVDYVFGRPVGEPAQEVGGVMVTLAALCLAAKMDMHTAGETELARIWTKVEQIRAKQAAKPKHSPLPIAQPSPAVAQPMAFREVAADGAPITDWIDGSLPPNTPPLHPGATIQFAYGAPASTAFPDALTPELSYVLGMPNFRCAPYAEIFRAAGHDIPRKAEAEQAFVIHRMARAVLQHGAGWDAAFAAELHAAAESARAAAAAGLQKGGA